MRTMNKSEYQKVDCTLLDCHYSDIVTGGVALMLLDPTKSSIAADHLLEELGLTVSELSVRGLGNGDLRNRGSRVHRGPDDRFQRGLSGGVRGVWVMGSRL